MAGLLVALTISHGLVMRTFAESSVGSAARTALRILPVALPEGPAASGGESSTALGVTGGDDGSTQPGGEDIRRASPVALSTLRSTGSGEPVGQPVAIGGTLHQDGLRAGYGAAGGTFVQYRLPTGFSGFQASMALVDRLAPTDPRAPIGRYLGPMDSVVVAVTVRQGARPYQTWNVRQGDMIGIDVDIRGAEYLTVGWHLAEGPRELYIGDWALIDARLVR